MNLQDNRAKFGPAGSCTGFTEAGFKHSVDMPKYLAQVGLDAFEYQCGRGVNIGQKTAEQLGEAARQYNISLSIHAPYYISMASEDETKRNNSIEYVLKSAIAADWMGAGRVVIHVGSQGKETRQDALELAKQTLRRPIERLDNEGYSHITICPETMGKMGQLGDLNETLEFCELDERIIPCIDFGHLNARSGGGLNSLESVRDVFDTIESRLGIDRLRIFHSHFSKIEYTAGGEKRHLTFEDKIFGPDFEPVAEMIVRKNCAPTIICESAGTQSKDALIMKNMYLEKIS